ncbi:MAG: GtrA family protein [Bacteroidota bacterium]
MSVKTVSGSSRLGVQIILFLFVGALCYAVDILLLYLFYDIMGLNVNLGNFFSSVIATYVAYVLNSRYIFSKGKYDPKKEISMFFILSFLGLLLNMSMMFVLTSYTAISIYISKTFVTLVVAAFNFVTRKFLVFNG